MKTLNKYIALVAIFVGMVISNSCWAIIIDDGGIFDNTEVGELDNLVDQANKVSGEAAELDWVNSILDPDVTSTIKDEDVAYYSTDGADTYAFQLLSEPGYYLIKNGGRMALYENVAELSWAVFDASLLTDGTSNSGKWNIPSSDFIISHVTQFNGGPDFDVPAPAILGVMAIGLLGVGFATRRKRT